MVIGKGGEERKALQNKLTKEYGKTVNVNVIEVKSPSTNAQLVAEDIARQLENRVTFRRAMKQCMRNAMSPRDRATVPQRASRQCAPAVWAALISPVPRATMRAPSPLQTLRADIDYGFAEAATTYGRIGVKVWIYKGEILKSAKARSEEGRRQQVMLLPKRVKYRRVQRGRMTGKAIPRQRGVPGPVRPCCSGAGMDHFQPDRGCSCCHDSLYQAWRQGLDQDLPR